MGACDKELNVSIKVLRTLLIGCLAAAVTYMGGGCDWEVDR